MNSTLSRNDDGVVNCTTRTPSDVVVCRTGVNPGGSGRSAGTLRRIFADAEPADGDGVTAGHVGVCTSVGVGAAAGLLLPPEHAAAAPTVTTAAISRVTIGRAAGAAVTATTVIDRR